MFKKKLKNPVLTVREPLKINQEYSEVVLQIGNLTIEVEGIKRAEVKQEARLAEIEKQQADLLDRVDELSQEMDASQKEMQRKAAEEAKAKAETEQPK